MWGPFSRWRNRKLCTCPRPTVEQRWTAGVPTSGFHVPKWVGCGGDVISPSGSHMGCLSRARSSPSGEAGGEVPGLQGYWPPGTSARRLWLCLLPLSVDTQKQDLLDSGSQRDILRPEPPMLSTTKLSATETFSLQFSRTNIPVCSPMHLKEGPMRWVVQNSM